MDYDNLFRSIQKSYQMLLVLTFLDLADKPSSYVSLRTVSEKFQEKLVQREIQGLPVDSPPKSIGLHWSDGKLSALLQVLETPLEALQNVFQRYEDHTIGFRDDFLDHIGESGLSDLRTAATAALERYWNRLAESNSGDFIGELHQRHHTDIRTPILHLMNEYLKAKVEPFAKHPLHLHMRKLAQEIKELYMIPNDVVVRASIGQGNWATVPWIAVLDTNLTSTTREGVYVCYLFAHDMSTCYLTIARGVTKYSEELGRKKMMEQFKELNKQDRDHLGFSGMKIDDDVNLSDQGLGRDYEASVIAYVKYERDSFPLNGQLLSDLDMVLQHYRRYVQKTSHISDRPGPIYNEDDEQAGVKMDFQQLISQVHDYVTSQGFTYDRELIANFLISLKVRPFVILAGISGTGKSKLVSYVARALGAKKENGRFQLIPVRPDWSDSADILGYRNLQGFFVPGPLTEIIEKASQDRTKPYFVLLDEMNLARVEYYLSDVLSILETQRREDGVILTDQIIPVAGLNQDDTNRYGSLIWPDNLLLVGTVNMDETTHPFSKKVLDRATTIEFNHVDLRMGLEMEPSSRQLNVSSAIDVPEDLFRSDYLVLRVVPIDYKEKLEWVVDQLTKLNSSLQAIGAQIGYRVRDVVAFFVVYSERFGVFTKEQAFDIQLMQKVLPRLQGSSGPLRQTLFRLLIFCVGRQLPDEPGIYQSWLPGKETRETALFSRSAEKVAYMLQKVDEDGFTSYWIS